MNQSYINRRWENTVQNTWPGLKTSTFVVNGVGLIAAILTSSVLGGLEFAWAEVKSWALFTLAWVIVANLLFLSWNWILSAGRLSAMDQRQMLRLESELEQHAQLAKRQVAEHITKLKLSIAEDVSKLVSFALQYGNSTPEEWHSVIDQIASVRHRAEQISYEKKIFGLTTDVIQLAGNVISDRSRHEINRGDREAIFAKHQELMRLLHGQCTE